MLDGYVSEKEQIESIRKWWHSNGKFILIAVVVGLSLGFGWKYWHQLQLRRDENAAMIYQSIIQADSQNNIKTAQGGAKLLVDQFPKTPYASLAALLSAKEFVSQANYADALTQLNWVIAHSDQPRLQQIARISAARILLSQNHPAEAMKTVSVVNDKYFAPLVAWVKGDIYTQQGDAKNAQANYAIAKDAFAQFPPAANLLNQLLAQPVK